MKEFIMKGYIKYVIAVSGVFGILFRMIISIVYRRLIRESENISASKLNLLKQMRLKFENCYRLHLGVNNIPAFVDKHIYKYKICGLTLHSMQRMTLLCAWLSAILGLAAGVTCYLWEQTALGLQYEGVGIGTAAILCTLHFVIDVQYEKTVFLANMKDFFENSLVNRLAHEYSVGMKNLTPEEKEMMKEIPVIQEAITRETSPTYKKGPIALERTKSKKKKKEASEVYDADIIEDVLSQYLP